MKTCKLLSIAVLAMAMSMVSCSGDDGEQGPKGEKGAQGEQGVNGIDGVDGTNGISCWDLNGNGTGDANEDINQDGNFDALDCQGADGTNGVDGNANVQAFNLDMTEWAGGTFFPFDMPIAAQERANYGYLFYLEYVAGGSTAFHPVPGGPGFGSFMAFVDYINDDTSPSGYITFKDFNGVDFDVPAGSYINLKIIAVEINTTAGKATQVNAMDQLKADGIDTKDYHTVAKYFGLE